MCPHKWPIKLILINFLVLVIIPISYDNIVFTEVAEIWEHNYIATMKFEWSNKWSFYNSPLFSLGGLLSDCSRVWQCRDVNMFLDFNK